MTSCAEDTVFVSFLHGGGPAERDKLPHTQQAFGNPNIIDS